MITHLVFGDRRWRRKMSRDLGRFPELTPGRRMFSDLPMLDIQWEDKGYSICQIVQNNDLPTAERNTNIYTHKQQYEWFTVF